MTSWDYAAAHPQLTEAEAEDLVRAHGLDPQEAREELGLENFITTAELIGWLGY
ncbi:hypothetical protein QWZ10_25420 [Paracoccus cavernae]|uniref:DUF3606 domain-containing protein n=1 Tax=Paracoccus cavernae TaxID=1571207 RepID=A0ABT8DF58_9RHOB|nr:hypothetical protein [Paracoccus cavernae]